MQRLLTPSQVRNVAHSICLKLGRKEVAKRLGKTTQAVGKALMDYDDPYKYLGLRMAIVGLCCGVRDEPLIEVTGPQDLLTDFV